MNKQLDFQEMLDYDVDGHKRVDYSFLSKLMKQNLWSEEFATRVELEYKKFMYLICTRGEAAPCYLVDQVWHLHMLYTKDYAAFCQKFNGEFIHHNPDRFRGNSDALFRSTLQNYRDTFGELPMDIWGIVGDFATIDLSCHYVIPTGDKKSLIKLLIKHLCGG